MLNYKLSIFLSLLLCLGCLDEIDLDVPAGLDNGIVVRGELIQSTPSRIKVNISRIFNFDLSTLSPINARAVTLIDEAGNELVIPSRQSVVEGSQLEKPDFWTE